MILSPVTLSLHNAHPRMNISAHTVVTDGVGVYTLYIYTISPKYRLSKPTSICRRNRQREGKSRRCCFGNVPTKYPFNSKDDLKKSFWKNIHFGSVVVWCGVNQMIIFFFWSIHSAKRLFFRSSWLGWSDFYFFIGQKTALNQRSSIILKVQIKIFGARAAKFSF